ncbi:PREDICTED: SKIP34 [Prunus dulcis]|uniref:PREDICTED: SKIP34 n=1 Tax=Prunus dulcis TaxID=3755 RepID=A0A5E4F0X5_PRUDU|nr:hypothetical protein L3X38_033933 [Prunus dulcis]VVA21060.1 PREDICTED: SKIP34 [Prunus dulcis]
MCYGQQRPFSRDNLTPTRVVRLPNDNAVVVADLRGRLAETEARLARARAREAELSRRLNEMKRFVSVMEILETYLKRRFREQQEYVSGLFSPSPLLVLMVLGLSSGPKGEKVGRHLLTSPQAYLLPVELVMAVD